MSIKVKEVIAMLEANGWRQARMNGDHRIFVKPGARRSITVAGHPAKDMPRRHGKEHRAADERLFNNFRGITL